jgi:hypothetical protein
MQRFWSAIPAFADQFNQYLHQWRPLWIARNAAHKGVALQNDQNTEMFA